MTSSERGELLRTLEQLGELEVRKKVIQEHYGGTKMLIVRAWLAEKDLDRTAAEAKRQHEQREKELTHLRGAKIAAWVAAIAALITAALFAADMWLLK